MPRWRWSSCTPRNRASGVVPESGAVPEHVTPSVETIASVRRLVNGYQVSQAIHVLVRLEIPDRLTDGPRSASDLAVEAGAHEPSLYRLLRAVAAVGLLEELPEHRFALTELGEALRSDVPGSVAGWAAPAWWPAMTSRKRRNWSMWVAVVAS